MTGSSRYLEVMGGARRRTAKYRSYGRLYDMVVATLPSDPVVLEVGIANGGSLETWRALLGPSARIIGVDLNPGATALEAEGFEVILLDTGRPESWRSLVTRLGRSVDLLVDDGGHTNRQQISALLHGVDLVRDGGWLVVEDLHASFMDEFGNPSRYSAARFLDDLADDLHRCHPRADVSARHPRLVSAVDHMVIGRSWAGLRIDRRQANAADEVTAGSDASLMDYDHRWDDSIVRIGGLVPSRVAPLIRNRFTARLTPWKARRLFRSDAAEQ